MLPLVNIVDEERSDGVAGALVVVVTDVDPCGDCVEYVFDPLDDPHPSAQAKTPAPSINPAKCRMAHLPSPQSEHRAQEM
jgi:hypothetical protein